jgi:hypothetical protein
VIRLPFPISMMLSQLLEKVPRKNQSLYGGDLLQGSLDQGEYQLDFPPILFTVL